MQVDGEVPQLLGFSEQCGNFEQSEHVDAGALGRRDNVAGRRHKDDERVQEPVHGGCAGALVPLQIRGQGRLRIGRTPAEFRKGER